MQNNAIQSYLNPTESYPFESSFLIVIISSPRSIVQDSKILTIVAQSSLTSYHTPLLTMHVSALGSIILLAFSTKSAAGAPPKGYSAYFSTFDHIGCDIQSLGLTTIQESQVGECLTFSYPAISASLESIQEGCARKLIPTISPSDFRGTSLERFHGLLSLDPG